MSFESWIISRTYQCTNKKCNQQSIYDERSTRKFRKRCPFCYKNTLLLHGASGGPSVLFDTKKAKTIGALSDQNYRQKEKEVETKKKKVPWWRKGKNKGKMNKDIMRNTKRYIETGQI